MIGDREVRLDHRPAASLRAAAFDQLGACAAVLDRDGVIVDTNQAWRLFAHLNDGPSDTTGIGVNYLDVCERSSVAGSTVGADVAAGLRQILSGERDRMDVEYPCPSPAEDRWFLLQASALPVSDGAGAVVFHVDVTARKQLTDRLVVLADHDALTGLPNRRAAVRFLDEQLALARASSDPMWLVFIDIDEFKSVNDTYGHHVGDELLVKVGMRARRALRTTDRLCRFGGDEFVAICPGVGRSDVRWLADRLRAVMSAPFQIGELEIICRISLGLAESDATSSAESMLRAADSEMYVDKRVVRPAPIEHGRERFELDGRGRAEAALTNSTDLILFFAADGTVEWAGPACLHLFGIRPEDIVGVNGIDLIHPDDRERAAAALMSIPNAGDRVTVEFRVIDAGGRLRWIEEVATNLLGDPAVGSVVGNLRDVTERVVLSERIELDRRRLADAQAAARLGSFESDLHTGDTSRSDELCRILGVPAGSVANSSGLENVHPDDRHEFVGMIDHAVAGRDRGDHEFRIVRPTGEERWVLARCARLAAPNDHLIGGTMLDITDRHAADEALEFQATHDWLTGLPNPASLHAGLLEALASGPETLVLVAAVGIDSFRHVNDIRGTKIGDAVLCALAERLRAASEPFDVLGRIRGDEFVVVRRVVAPADASEFGQQLDELLSEPLAVSDGDVPPPPLSFSVGVTTSTGGDTPESMLAHADAAMHDAKRHGGGRVVVSDDDARARATRRRTISAALGVALERDELRLEYQPILDLDGLRTVGFEALLRWTHPALGPVSPAEFIPIAEANRLIVPIGAWVIDHALQQLAAWHLEPAVPADLWMSINLSAQQLAEDDLSARIGASIAGVGVPAGAVHLEITESVLMDRIDHALATATDLRSLGVHITIDDFGTGYSSLSYVSRLPVDTIKIDQSFVQSLSTGSNGKNGRPIIGAMVTLADSLGLRTVAEGIETTEQLDVLRALGCTSGQGFLWSRSLHPADALRWITTESTYG